MAREDTGLLKEFLNAAVARGASDLHLAQGYRPTLRIQGDLVEIPGEPLDAARIESVVSAMFPPGAAERLEERRSVDFAFSFDCEGRTERFRASVFYTRGERAVCVRHIPSKIPDLADLGFPEELAGRIAALTNGLVLVTGITGAGKSTTLASLVKRINHAGGCRIITIEEPVEYLFDHAPRSMVTQREVGSDVPSFYEGLRSGLRQDPDLLLVGEIRDRETAQLALSAAETGHVIFATLHSPDARGAITRLVDLFPSEQQNEVRTQLSMSLRFVVAQHLLPARERGGRRVLALEVLSANFAVRASIRTGKIEALDTAIQSGRRDGMWSLDQHLKQLVQEGRIDAATARQFAKDLDEVG